MSQLAGGRADKFGNEFERHWVVFLALDVVEGRASSLKWEPLGPVEAGVDCEVRSPDGTLTKYQCKALNGTKGSWSASDLSDVLSAAKAHLEASPVARFAFASGDAAPVLRSFVERARTSDSNGKDFLAYCLTSTDHKREYQSLCKCWGLQPLDEGDAQRSIGLLQRIEFHQAPDIGLLYRLAEGGIDGDGGEVVAHLGRYLEDNLGNSLRSDQLREALRAVGHPPLDLHSDPRVLNGIERLQKSFRETLEPHLIGSALITRPEAAPLVERLRAQGGARLVFVTGDAGSGKSGVLLEVLKRLGAEGVPYIPIRLDTHYPDKSVRAFSKECLDLPASPATCLRVLADGRRAVLIIDQLDAVRWTSANSDGAWQRCKAIIDEALQLPNASVVVAGRTVDLDEDPRIQHWTKGKKDSHGIDVQRFNVGPMSEQVVAAIVDSYGVKYASLSPGEKLLLSNAQNLQLWWRLAADGKALHFSSRVALLRSFWSHYRDKSVRDCHVPASEVKALLDRLVEFMDKNGRLDAPSLLLDGEYAAAALALRTLNIIHTANDRARFAHQSHLDYLTIERVLRRALEGETAPIDWLRADDQSLFRRDQVRLLLQLLRDQDVTLYGQVLEAVLFGGGVRFHIQHLVLTTLAQVSRPSADEYKLVKRLLSESDWRLHVLERVLTRREPWLEAFTVDGTIPSMLSSGQSAQRDQAILLCWRSAEVAPAWFERVLTPHWNSKDPKWADLIGRVLSNDADLDTATVFEWRLERARAGANDPDVYNAEQLAKKDGSRAIAFIAAIAEGLISNVEKAAEGDKQRSVQVERERFEHLTEACRSYPREAWTAIAPVYRRAVAVHDRLAAGKFNVTAYEVILSANRIVALLHDLLVVTGSALLSAEGASFLSELTALGQAPTVSHFRQLVVDALARAPAILSDAAAECFLSIDRPLDIETAARPLMRDDLLSAQDPAIAALRALTGTCSAAILQRVERMVLAFHTVEERRSIEWQRDRIHAGKWSGNPNDYGLPQYALLLALPEARMSDNGRRALWLWQRKFGDLYKYRDSGPNKMLMVVSPIPGERARFVSDDEWVSIVAGDRTKARPAWREIRREKYIESSPSEFAASLESAGKLNPARYVRLGVRFHKDANASYYRSLLTIAGLVSGPDDVKADSWFPAAVHDVESLIEHVVANVNSEIALAVCRTVGSRSSENWSEHTRARLREYALHHPNPEGELRPDSIERDAVVRQIEMDCLNAVRPSAIRAIAQLLWAHPELLGWARGVAEETVRDRHPAVRAAALELANAVGKHDLDGAVELLVGACLETDPAVLAVHYGPYLLRVVWRREKELAQVLRRALESSDEEAAKLAAYWATVGNLVEGIYAELAQAAASGVPHQRVGVVEALISMVQHESYRTTCLAKLTTFLNDPDDKVLHAVDGMFRRDGFLNMNEAPEFAHKFARSVAFRHDPTMLLHRLVKHEGSLLPFADTIEACVAQLSGALAASTQSSAYHNSMAAGDIATILLRLYQQSEAASDRDLRRRCLDQWDALLKARVGMDQDVLTKIDGA